MQTTTAARQHHQQSLAAKMSKLLGQAATADEKPQRTRAARVPADLCVKWAWGEDEREGKLLNISASGCYVKAEHGASVGDQVRIKLFVPDFLCVELGGLVVRAKRDEGFAVRFRKLGPTEQFLLEHVTRHLSAKLKAAENNSPGPN